MDTVLALTIAYVVVTGALLWSRYRLLRQAQQLAEHHGALKLIVLAMMKRYGSDGRMEAPADFDQEGGIMVWGIDGDTVFVRMDAEMTDDTVPEPQF